MKNNAASLKRLEVWFITGSQHLYGEETLKKVARHSVIITKSLNEAGKFLLRLFLNRY